MEILRYRVVGGEGWCKGAPPEAGRRELRRALFNTRAEKRAIKMQKFATEHELLCALKVGDSAAVREWFSGYKPALERMISVKVAVLADVDEIVQQTFLNSLRQLPLFRGEASLKTWMYSIARHEVADYYRKKYAKKALQTLPLSDLLLSVPIDDAQATSQKVTEVLEKMSDRSRELLLQKYVDGKQVMAIAAEFGKSVKAIESELFRARGEFRVLWERPARGGALE
jgi:RNA polymerase sigma-70 factor (ECF subfamily)